MSSVSSKNSKKAPSTSSEFISTIQDVTSFTVVITIFTGLVILFVVIAMSYFLYAGLLESNPTVNPPLNLTDVRLTYDKDENGTAISLPEQLDTWWSVIFT